MAPLGVFGAVPLLETAANMRADIFLAMGQRDGARGVLAGASKAFPQNARRRAQLDSLK